MSVITLKQPSLANSHRERWKRAYIEHFRDLKFNVALTLSWNYSRSIQTARDDLKKLLAKVDRKLLGRHFNTVPHTERTRAVFVFEGIGVAGHLHVHSLWRLKSGSDFLTFARLFPNERGGCWNSIVNSGSYKLAINDDDWTFGGYALKEQHMSSDDTEMLWSDEFHR